MLVHALDWWMFYLLVLSKHCTKKDRCIVSATKTTSGFQMGGCDLWGCRCDGADDFEERQQLDHDLGRGIHGGHSRPPRRLSPSLGHCIGNSPALIYGAGRLHHHNAPPRAPTTPPHRSNSPSLSPLSIPIDLDLEKNCEGCGGSCRSCVHSGAGERGRPPRSKGWRRGGGGTVVLAEQGVGRSGGGTLVLLWAAILTTESGLRTKRFFTYGQTAGWLLKPLRAFLQNCWRRTTRSHRWFISR